MESSTKQVKFLWGGQLFTVKLKVKENANGGNTNITLTNISSSDGTHKKTYPKVSTKVLVTNDGQVDKKTSTNKVTENKEKVIITFPTMKVAICLLIIALVLLGIIIYINVNSKNKKKTNILIIIDVILFILVITLLTLNNLKKDVNNDGKKDYKDAEEIIDYLIDIEGTKEKEESKQKDNDKNDENKSNTIKGKKSIKKVSSVSSLKENGNNKYDVNGDGKVDVNDPAHMAEEANKNSSAKLSEVEKNSQYIEKGKDIILTFKAKVTPKGVTVKKVKIGNKYYDVTLDGDTYSVNVGNKTEAGQYEFEITDVVLSNDKEISSKLKFKKEVLKSAPTVKDLFIDDTKDDPEVHFTLVDDDSAVVSGKIIVKDEDGNVVDEIKAKDLKKENKYVLDNIESSKKYTLSIELTYDLDTDRNNKKNEKTEVVQIHEFTIEKNYNFTLENFEFVKIENGKVILQFESENSSKYDIEKVEVLLNDIKYEYKVIKTDDGYTIEIPLTDINNKRTKITLDAVILSNLKEFNKETNEELFNKLKKPVVFKNKPTTKIGDVEVNSKETEITVENIKTLDSDKTITSKYAVLIYNGTELERKQLNDDTEITFESTENEKYKAGIYMVQIIADYDFVDGLEHKEEVLATSNPVEIKPHANIKTSEISNRYPEKSEEISIIYEITSNTDEDVTEITINGRRISVEKTSENHYKVVYTVKNTFGIEELKVTQIKFNNDKTVDLTEKPHKDEVDVLKTLPEIKTINVLNNKNNVIITFDVEDLDDALIDSYIKIVEEDSGEVKYNKKITKGENRHEVELKYETQYKIAIDRNYSLASDDSHEVSETYFEREINIVDDNLDFIIKNLSVPYRVSPNETNVKVTFENEILTSKNVSSMIIGGREYPVSIESDGSYSVTLDVGEKGLNTLYVESVKLDNKTYDVDRHLSYVRVNEKPTANNQKVEEDTSTDKIKVSCNVTDKDNAIQSLFVNLRDSDGALVSTEEIPIDDKNNFEIPLIKSNNYTLELVAKYDIGDHKTFEEVSLFSETREVKPYVSISESTINKEIVEKEQEVTLTYKINTNVDKEVSKLFIGRSSYPVKKVKNKDDTYTVTLNAPKETGIFEQVITRAVIGNKPYEVSKETDPIEIKVYKDIASISQFTIDPKEQEVSFKLDDKDESLKGGSAKLVIVEKDNETQKVEQNLNVSKNYFTYTFSELGLTDGKEYTAKVDVEYNLNPVKKETSISNVYETKEIFSKDITIPNQENYTFTFVDDMPFYLGSTNPDYEENTPMLFTFTSNADSEVEKVIIDGEEFSVKAGTKPNQYQVERYIPKIPKDPDNSVGYYEKIILKNGISFDIEKEEGQFYITLLNIHASTEITDFVEDFEKDTIVFFYDVIDPDNTINSDMTFTLKNSAGGKIGEKTELKPEAGYVEFDVKGKESSKYILDTVASQSLASGVVNPRESLGTHNVDSKINTRILSVKYEKTRYASQGGIIPITYKISSTKITPNIDRLSKEALEEAVMINSLIINGKDYPVEPVSGTTDEYRVYYLAQDKAGVEDINVSEITFVNSTSEGVKYEDKIDVLKNIPKIEDFEATNDVENNKVTFKFKVTDEDSVLDEDKIYAKVDGKNQKPVSIGKNTLEFSVEKDKVSKFTISASYDLDSNTLGKEEDNSYKDNAIFERDFVLKDSYDIDFENIKTFNEKGEETNFFEKEEQIKLSFEFVSEHQQLYPEKIRIGGKDYKLTKDINNENTYFTTINGYKKIGETSINIDSVTLSSGNKIELEDQKFTIEILKDVIKVDDFEYSLESDNKVKLDISISDKDKSLVDEELSILVEDEDGQEVEVNKKDLTVGDNTITFTRDNSVKYIVKIIASYKRDSKGEKHYEDEEIATEVVTLNNKYIELKDITNIDIYKFASDGDIEKASTLTEKELSKFIPKNYLVKITMSDLPTFYSEIKDVHKTENGYKLKLDNKDLKVYEKEDLKSLEIELTKSSDGSYTYNSKVNGTSSKIDDNYLPDREMITSIEEYNSSNKTIYHNMYKLMPFYDIKDIIRYGNKIVEQHPELNEKVIKCVLAYGKDGKLVNYLTTTNYKTLSRIRIVFTDGTGKDYKVNFDDYIGNVALYIIPELKVGYNYNKYVMKDGNDIIKQLSKEVSNLDYDRQVDPISSYIKDSRVYKEHYEKVINKNTKDIIASVLVSKDYIPTFENDVLKSIIKEKFTNEELKKILYTYNYLDYWYDFNMSGATISDTIAFYGKEMFDNDKIFENIEKEIVSTTISNPTKANSFFNGTLKKYINKGTIVDFMEYYINALTNYETGNDWFKDNWNGGIYREIDIEKDVPEEQKQGLEYNFWWHFKYNKNAQNYFLALFNVPEDSMYVISMPTTLFFGSLKVYIRDPKSTKDMETLNKMLDNFEVKMSRFYQFALTFSKAEYINKSHQIMFDQRLTYTDDPTQGRLWNDPGTTEDPYHKYFMESINKWASGGSGAYATGTEVFFVWRRTLDDITAITHESAHNQDGGIFLLNNSIRGAGEDFATGVIEQSWSDGGISPNMIEDFDGVSEKDGMTTQNWSYKRIDTPEEFKDYYEKLFRVVDYLDLLESKAFLELTPQDKATIARQHSYPNTDNKNDEGGTRSVFSPADVEVMGRVKTREDLWDNGVVLRFGREMSYGINGYAADNIYATHWYQPHNNNGRPNTLSMKYLFWEMSGIGGYYDGFVAYGSKNYIRSKTGQNVTDLVALRYITGNPDITFREYKLGRYKKLEDDYGFDFNGNYINGQQILDEFRQAMKTDAENGDRDIKKTREVKKKYILKIKELTEDLIKDPFTNNNVPVKTMSLKSIDEPLNNISLKSTEKPQPFKPKTLTEVVIDTKEEDDNKEGLQQDDPTNTTGPVPDPNPDSVQTPAVVLPFS